MINNLWSSPRIFCFRDLPSIPFCLKWEVFICVSVKLFYETGSTVRDAVSQIDDFFLAKLYLLILSEQTSYCVNPTESWIMISITITIMVCTMINTSFCTFGTWLPLKCTKSLIYFPKCTALLYVRKRHLQYIIQFWHLVSQWHSQSGNG